MSSKIKINNKKIILLIVTFLFIGIILGGKIAKRVVKGDDLLAFIGAVIGSGIGVLGAFFIYRFQVEHEEISTQNLNSNFIKELLIYTITETDSLILYMMNSYISLFVQNTNLKEKTVGFLMLKEQLQESSFLNLFQSDYEKKTFPYMIDEVMRNAYIFKSYQNAEINKAVNIISKDIIKSKQKDIRTEILEEYRNKSNFRDLVYDDNWCQYVHNMGNIKFEDIRSIIRWLTTLSKDIENEILRIDSISKKIELLTKVNDDLKSKAENSDNDEVVRIEALTDRFDVERNIFINNKKKRRLEKEISKNICDFIYYRDEVILILQKHFNFKDFDTSTEVLNNRFGQIENQILRNANA